MIADTRVSDPYALPDYTAAVDSAGILASSVGLVGPGRAGRAFARSWKDAGGHLAWVLARGKGKVHLV